MTFVLLEHMACHRQDTWFSGLGALGVAKFSLDPA